MQVHPVIIATLLICIIIEITESTPTSIVQISSGPVRGKILKTARRNVEYASFQGIPYAKSPEGELRFQPPVEIENWSKVFDAYQEGSACIQIDQTNIIGSENCLFLNVHTPHTNFTKINKKNLKPVMVWIHGGGYNGGTGNKLRQGPDFILEEDVIMVSMNYRLGPFGFLNLNHKNASGNMALKDQNLVLKWVKKNIAKFGGNPNQVTIFGESAGSVCVDYQILSDMSAGLFNQSIAMSGSALNFIWGVQSGSEAYLQARLLALKLGSKAETSEEILKFLKTVSAKDIIAKANENTVLPFRPTVERVSDVNNEKFLPECSIDKYRSGDFNKGPHMLGFTSREIQYGWIAAILNQILDSQELMKNVFNTSNDAILNQFSNSDYPLGTAQDIARDMVSKAATDLLFETGIDSKQKLLSQHNEHPIFYYRFSFESDLGAEIYNRTDDSKNTGVPHGEDLFYLFYHYSPFQIHNKNPHVIITISRFVRLLTNFAKFGNPTPQGKRDSLLKVKWPNSGKFGLHLDINKELTVGPRPVSFVVLINEALGLGTSRTLNDCL